MAGDTIIIQITAAGAGTEPGDPSSRAVVAAHPGGGTVPPKNAASVFPAQTGAIVAGQLQRQHPGSTTAAPTLTRAEAQAILFGSDAVAKRENVVRSVAAKNLSTPRDIASNARVIGDISEMRSTQRANIGFLGADVRQQFRPREQPSAAALTTRPRATIAGNPPVEPSFRPTPAIAGAATVAPEAIAARQDPIRRPILSPFRTSSMTGNKRLLKLDGDLRGLDEKPRIEKKGRARPKGYGRRPFARIAEAFGIRGGGRILSGARGALTAGIVMFLAYESEKFAREKIQEVDAERKELVRKLLKNDNLSVEEKIEEAQLPAIRRGRFAAQQFLAQKTGENAIIFAAFAALVDPKGAAVFAAGKEAYDVVQALDLQKKVERQSWLIDTFSSINKTQAYKLMRAKESVSSAVDNTELMRSILGSIPTTLTTTLSALRFPDSGVMKYLNEHLASGTGDLGIRANVSTPSKLGTGYFAEREASLAADRQQFASRIHAQRKQSVNIRVESR